MNKIYILFTLCFLWIGTIQLHAQPAVTFIATASDINPAVGDVITVTVSTGTGFTGLLGAQFGLNFNGAALVYVPGSENVIPVSPDPLATWQLNKRPNKSEIVNVWVHLGFAGVTAPPNTPIYTVDFEVISDMGNSIEILCGGDEVGCEFTDDTLTRFTDLSIDQPLEINGGGAAQNLGPIIVDISSEQAPTGDSVCVSFAVSDFVDIVSTQFSIQYDPSILSIPRVLQDDPSVSNPLDISFLGNFNLFEPGTITFSFSDFGAQAFTLADGTVIFNLCFDVIGAGGTSSDIFIDENPIIIEVIKNGEGNTNFGLTSNVGSVDVTGAGGPLDVISYSIGVSSGDAGTSVCVPVTVDDGFNDILGFGWSMDYDDSILDFTTLQNVHPSLSTLSSNEVSSGNLSFFWTAPFAANSEVTLPDGTVLYEMCYDIIGDSGQVSPISFSDSPSPIETVKIDGPDPDTDQDLTIVNTNNGSVTVSNSAGFNLVVCDVDACPGDQLCVPFLTTGATGIASLSFTLQYDPAVLTFTGPNPDNIAPNVQAFEPPTNLGNVNVIYFPFDGSVLNLQDCEAFGEFCFDVIGTQGESSSIVVGSDPTVFQASILDGGFPVEIEVAASNGAVNIDCSGTPGSPIANCACGNTPDNLTIDSANSDVNDITCNGEQDGSVTLSVSGGEAPLTFAWSGGQTTQDVVDLGAGTHTVTVTDNGGMMVSATFMIVEPQVLQPNSAATNTTTQTSNDGTITLNVSGGTAPYSYDWSNNETTANLTDLEPGQYDVTITDANNCTVLTSRTIGTVLTLGPSGGPGSPAGTTIITDVMCFGDITGSIDLALSGGVAPFSIDWDNGVSQEDQTGLAAGTYCVTVVDTNGESIDDCYTIVGPAALLEIIIVAETPQSIPGANDGAIDINVVGGEGLYTYLWNGPGINNETTQDISSLSDGTYSVQVTDERGCIRVMTFTLGTAGTTLAIDSNGSSVATIACFGDNNGAINPAVSGGVAPYIFDWSGPDNFMANTQNISGLAAGTYQLIVTDSNGAEVESDPFLITEPSAALTATGQPMDESAPNMNDGGVDLTVTGGTSGYSFIWNNNFNTEDITGLTRGTYTVTITDSRGCTFVDSYVVATDADPLIINAQGSTVVSVRCFGDSNGSIESVINGGAPPYNYMWDSGQTTATISGLAAGEYTLTVTDQGGQSDIQTFLIGTPPPLDIAVNSSTPETGNGNDGSISITVAGGAPGYSYSWSGPGGYASTEEDIMNLEEGIYTVTVFDSNGCSTMRDILLGAVLSIENKFEIDVNCFGECTGEIDIVVIGGRPPYLYSWSGPDNFTASTQDINDLCAGVYEVTITDNASQNIFTTCRIDEPLLALSIGQNPTIVNEVVPNLGSVNITVSGGTAPYTYTWNNGATSEDLTNLGAGSYRVTVRDANGCIVISPEYDVERVAVDINVEMLSINSPTCAGDCNGSVSMQIQGGDAPYELVWNDGLTQTLSTTNPLYTREDMCADEYTLTITDANGQVHVEDNIELLDLDPILIEGIVTPEIMGMDGTINTTVTGGQPPYTYDWAPSTLPDTPDQANLTAGLYIVTVTDANECTAIKSFVVDDEIAPLACNPNAVINQIDCSGDTDGSINITVAGGVQPYSFQWNDNQSQTTEDAIGLGQGTYNVTITDNEGEVIICGPFVITDLDPIFASVQRDGFPNPGNEDGRASVVGLVGGTAPYAFEWESGEITQEASMLSEGPQSVIITDANGCVLILDFDLTDDIMPTSVIFSSVTDVACNGDASGLACVQISGGIAPHDILWSTGETTECISGLLAGEYCVTVSNSQTIQPLVQCVTITEPEPLNIEFVVVEPTGPLSADGSAEAIVTGGCAPYTYQWNNPMGGGCNTPLCEGLVSNTYFVVVQDAKECILVDSIGVKNQFGGECLETRNIITPGDADGLNDTFLIQCAPGSINTLEIYNRFGQLVFITDNYDNTWAGTDRRGNLLPAGGYYYVFLLEDAGTGETVPFQGHITILRQ